MKVELINILSYQYIKDFSSSKNVSIKAFTDNSVIFIPLDPANRHYAEIMRQVEAGTLVIQPADEQPQPEEPNA